MNLERKIEDLQSRIDELEYGSKRGWSIAYLPDWDIKEIYNPETKSMVIVQDNKYYMATLINTGVLVAPDPLKHAVIWFHQGSPKAEAKHTKPKPYTKDDARIKDGKLPIHQSFVMLVDKKEFPEPQVASESLSGVKTGTTTYDKYSPYDTIIEGKNGTGIFMGKDGSMIIKGPGGEFTMGPDGVLVGGNFTMDQSNQNRGGIMATNPLDFLPSFCVLPLPQKFPDINLALKVASITSAIMKFTDAFKGFTQGTV